MLRLPVDVAARNAELLLARERALLKDQQREVVHEAADAISEMDRAYVVMSPFEGLESPVVASAWGIQLSLDSADDERLQAFLAKYVEGEQTPEPGAPCTGGIDPSA